VITISPTVHVDPTIDCGLTAGRSCSAVTEAVARCRARRKWASQLGRQRAGQSTPRLSNPIAKVAWQDLTPSRFVGVRDRAACPSRRFATSSHEFNSLGQLAAREKFGSPIKGMGEVCFEQDARSAGQSTVRAPPADLLPRRQSISKTLRAA